MLENELKEFKELNKQFSELIIKLEGCKKGRGRPRKFDFNLDSSPKSNKECRKCKRILPLIMFNNDKKNIIDGKRYTCKDCDSKTHKEYLLKKAIEKIKKLCPDGYKVAINKNEE